MFIRLDPLRQHRRRPPTARSNRAWEHPCIHNLRIKCSDKTDYKRIEQVGLLFNSASDGAHGCYVVYLPLERELRLVSDDGASAIPYEIGDEKKVLENSSCTVAMDRFEVLGRGKTLSVRLAFRFKPDFIGLKNFVLSLQNNGGQTPGWNCMAFGV